MRLYLLFCLIITLSACVEEQAPTANQVVDHEKSLLTAGYCLFQQFNISGANKLNLELDGLTIKLSGPESLWNSTTSCFKLLVSFDQGINWQESLIKLQDEPVSFGKFAFIYTERQMINDIEIGTLKVFSK